MNKLGYIRLTCKNCDTLYMVSPKDKKVCPHCNTLYTPFTKQEAIAYRSRKILKNLSKNLGGNTYGQE